MRCGVLIELRSYSCRSSWRNDNVPLMGNLYKKDHFSCTGWRPNPTLPSSDPSSGGGSLWNGKSIAGTDRPEYLPAFEVQNYAQSAELRYRQAKDMPRHDR